MDNSKESGKSNECYFCIHNIINKVDLTPMVAPYEMGFKRYGVDHYIPGDPTVMDTPQQAVMGLVFRILKYDYDNVGKMDKSTKGEMWIAGTFAKNTDAILQGHVPKIVLVKDSEGLLPRDENTGDVVIDEATNSVTMTMRPGSYDRFTVDLKPYVTAYSTDATKLSWSASGGVSVKNGVVFAKKATKEGKPAKVTIKCAKSKPLTIYINVK